LNNGNVRQDDGAVNLRLTIAQSVSPIEWGTASRLYENSKRGP
jgi:hypothetical protein